MNLTELREEINAIDQELVQLFCKRMEVASRIADYKQQHELPIYHPTREEEVLQRVSSMAGQELEAYVQALYRNLFELSRQYQASRNEEKESSIGGIL